MLISSMLVLHCYMAFSYRELFFGCCGRWIKFSVIVACDKIESACCWGIPIHRVALTFVRMYGEDSQEVLLKE